MLIKGSLQSLLALQLQGDMQDFRPEDFIVILPQGTGVNHFLGEIAVKASA